MEDLDKKIMEETISKAKTILNRITFIKYYESDFCTSENVYYSPWYEFRAGKYYKFYEERGQVNNNLIANTEDEMVDYFIRDIIFRYASDYELKNRHHFEDHLRLRDTIEEFCYNLIDIKKNFKREYDDEWAIISDLLNVYRKKCMELKETYERIAVDTSDIDYMIKRGYADNPSGGMSNPKQSIKKAHDKIEIIQEKFPETKEYFKLYEKYYNKIIFD